MNSIQLETPRLSLRLMRLSDIDGFLGIFGDPLVMAHLTPHLLIKIK